MNKISYAEEQIRRLETELETRNVNLQRLEFDTASQQRKMEEELTAKRAHTLPLAVVETLKLRHLEELEHAVKAYQAEYLRLEDSGEKEIAAAENHLETSEESAEQVRLQDLEQAMSSLQKKYEL